MKQITVALVGNPNCGKSSIFNMLTGAHQHVANYPGTTVESKEGRCAHRSFSLRIVDLPGTYSLTAYSTEELVTRHFVLDSRPDVVVDVIDASNIERHLYLATQLIEMNAPLVLAFNMSDLAKQRGLEFDLPQLSALLGGRIVPTVGSKRQGREALLDAIVATAEEVPGSRGASSSSCRTFSCSSPPSLCSKTRATWRVPPSWWIGSCTGSACTARASFPC
jgi:ferrous iron transport protein B